MKHIFSQKKAFIAYFTAGDGGVNYSVDAGLALLEGGVDILEIGVPFSDPIADGPTIQKACVRSLKNGTTPDSVLEIAARINKQKPDAPLVLFSYFNPILQGGYTFLRSAREAGFSHMLLLDLPFDHSFYSEQTDLEPILVVSPSTPENRIAEIANRGRGFLYYACQKGTTGVRNSLPSDVSTQLNTIKRMTSTPVVAGFGIADSRTAKEVCQDADGFVVGSAFVKLIEDGSKPEALKELARSIDPRSSK